MFRISYEKVLEAAKFIENSLTSQDIIFQPKLGIICGTGLGINIYKHPYITKMFFPKVFSAMC